MSTKLMCGRLKIGLAVNAAALSLSVIANSSAIAATSVLEEVIVTAEKRESSLLETAIAITALTSDQLKDLNVVTQQDVANITPSMSYQETAGGGEGNRIYLRGIGRETSSLGTEPGVGLYNNGFYTTESSILNGAYDRIARIEVLRGPQGTLYGRNTTGGAINVIAKRPSDTNENIVRVNIGNYQTQALSLTSSGPISDTVGYLLHYSNLKQDSVFTNVSGPDPIGIDSEYLEAQLDVDITETINWHFRYFSAQFENETLERNKLDGYRNEVGAPSKLGALVINPELFSPIADAPSDPFSLSSDFTGSVKMDGQDTYQSTVTIDLEALQIKVLNGYQTYNWYGEKDLDGTASPVSYVEKIGQYETNKQHEIQFISAPSDHINWVAGLFYYNVRLDQPYTLADATNPYLINNLSGLPNPDGIFYTQTGTLNSTSTAAYGQFDWQVNQKLSLSFGARYSKDKKTGTETQLQVYDAGVDYCTEATLPFLLSFGPYFNPAQLSPALAGCRFGLVVGGGNAQHKASWDAFDWRLNATYQVSEDELVYATVSTAYKPGGFRLGGLQDDPTTSKNESIVDNEDLVAFELGYKGKLSDTLSVATTAFYYDYSDLQVELDILDPTSGIVTSRLANASSATIKGLEIESQWQASERFKLLASASLLDSEYTDDFFVSDNKTNQVRNVKGNELNRAPGSKISLAAYYSLPIAGGELLSTANYSRIGEQSLTVFNDDIETLASYTQVNARISWRPQNTRYEIALYGSNLTDELSYANDYAVSGLQDGVRRSGRPINPKTYGLEFALFF